MNRTAHAWTERLDQQRLDGARFAGLYATAVGQSADLVALFARPHGIASEHLDIRPDTDGVLRYDSVTDRFPAAFWYERALHDLSGIEPQGHPRLDPLLLPGGSAPRLGSGAGDRAERASALDAAGPIDVVGEGLFVLPLGPVRSGVVESVEFLLESPGEDIPHMNIRPHFKHRGIARRFEGMSVDDGALLAERVEGTVSVAHALAFSHAVERIAHTEVPERAGLIRVVHAELERIANHLEVAARLAEAAGLAVAASRMTWHKEVQLRLISALCGNRFGRNVVQPGGVRATLRVDPLDAMQQLMTLYDRIASDLARMMRTPSFLDRLRTTGHISQHTAAAWGLLGPVGRASGFIDDSRWNRPTDAYGELAAVGETVFAAEGDVQARLDVRRREIEVSVLLTVTALRRLHALGDGPIQADLDVPTGEHSAVGWAEGPNGEVLHALTIRDRGIVRNFARSPSFHNLAAFRHAFHTEVFTDFAFIEASFGLSYAGVAM